MVLRNEVFAQIDWTSGSHVSVQLRQFVAEQNVPGREYSGEAARVDTPESTLRRLRSRNYVGRNSILCGGTASQSGHRIVVVECTGFRATTRRTG